MIRKIIEKLGYDSNQYEKQIEQMEKHLTYTERLWDVDDDIVIDILYENYHNDIDGACDIIDTLEKEFGDTIYLYYALVFRDKHIKEERELFFNSLMFYLDDYGCLTGLENVDINNCVEYETVIRKQLRTAIEIDAEVNHDSASYTILDEFDEFIEKLKN